MSRLVTQPCTLFACTHLTCHTLLGALAYLKGAHGGDEGTSTLQVWLGSTRLPPHIRNPCQHNLQHKYGSTLQ
jgi:hypothetical protein